MAGKRARTRRAGIVGAAGAAYSPRVTIAPDVTLSHYRLIERLGQGAMGEVWLAEDTQLPRRVAVKLLAPHLASDREAVERLLREAQAAASVDHPAVVTVYEAGTENGRPYIVMQRVEGETLEQRLARGPLPIAEAVRIVAAIADALAEVHALGIVHRDLKASNIVLSAHGPRVLDFGIASIKGSPQLTGTGMYLGTPVAMSPEQIRGLPPDNRSDLWALGVLLYRCLTGIEPFDGPSFEVVARRVLEDQPPPPSRLRLEIGPDLDFMVAKLLRKDPAHRYARAEDLIADLESCEACQVTPVAPPEPSVPRLAVLPFEVLSPEADDAFLASGLAEDLMVDFARVRGLRVVSRAEIAALRDRGAPARTLGRELGADFLLQGSVRRAGPRARISAQLVRASDGYMVWAERFDRTIEDLFEVQAEVSRHIVEALRVTLSPDERAMLDRAPTRNAEAYALYLKARERLAEGDRAGNEHAEVMLRQALALDPQFALAMGALAVCYGVRTFRWMMPDEATKALDWADRALALEPGLIDPLYARAVVGVSRGDPAMVRAAAEPILDRDPDDAQALEWAAFAMTATQEPSAMVPRLEALAEAHPDSPRITIQAASANEMAGNAARAATLHRLSIERLTEYLERKPFDAHARSLLAGQLAIVGNLAAGLVQIERALALAPDDGRVWYNAACMYARAGNADRAIEILKQYFGPHPGRGIGWPHRDPDLAILRGHPVLDELFPVDRS